MNCRKQNNTPFCEIAENKDKDELFITFPDEHIPAESFEVIHDIKLTNLAYFEAEYYCTSTPKNISLQNIVRRKCHIAMQVLFSLTHELQTLNVE